jgi:ribonucleotide reductase alpha subunit
MEHNFNMAVIKRNGKEEELSFDKILKRIKTLCCEAKIQINYQSLAMKVIEQLYDKIHTTKIDELASEQCAMMSTLSPDYSVLAGRIVISNHQKNTKPSFTHAMRQLYNFKDIHGVHRPLVSDELWEFTKTHSESLDKMIVHERDYLIDYFGFKTLERAYLLKIGNKVIERPQHMWLRVAIGIHCTLDKNIDKENTLHLIKETYDLMSLKYFTHATPTLFNAGTPKQQLSSCYLLAMEDDSLYGIYNTLKDCALISKYAGGIGLHIHNIRAKGTHIQGTNGVSNGIVPMLRVFNNTARYVDQCVTPETFIYTDKGPIQIQHCSMGETNIINIKGTCEVIENVLEHPYEGEIYNIETAHCIDNLKITPEHPIFVLRNKDNCFNTIEEKSIEEQLQKNSISFEWIEARELKAKDMLIYSIPSYNVDISSLTEDDCYMYGVILASGNMLDKDCYIFISSTNGKVFDFCIHYFERKYVQYTIEKYENTKTTIIKWSKNINMPFRYNDMYDNNKNKYIQSKWLNLPIEKSKFILKGLLDVDGYIGEEAILENMSRNLVESVRYICLKMGILTGGYKDLKNSYYDNGVKDTFSYCLKIPKTDEICKLINISYEKQFIKYFFKYNNYLLTNVTHISREKYSGTLYDLQMKEEHNYMIHNGLIHNGGGKRNGSFAIYLESWHADILDFLEMRKNHGDEEMKARDLFYALWVSDLFMERVQNDKKWALMCPHECPGLSDVYGDEFVKLYEKYECEGKYRKMINARDLWFKILDAQMETGTPYLLYKDAANYKSNQKNLGTIKSSNLCTEILEYSDANETAVCNLASIALPSFVNTDTKSFDYEKLHEVTKVVTNNLNKVIDINYYPTEKTRVSNLKHRPIGIGVQGLADTFILMDVPFCSEQAKEINKLIFETIYHASLEKSNEIAILRKESIKNGINTLPLNEFEKTTDINDKYIGAYSSFVGSPASKGILQFDLWNATPTLGRYDWDSLKKSIINHGLRNSLLVAPMPTASTSQILGFNECFEPFTSNLYTRRTLAGEFIIVNKYLMRELIELGLWNEEMKNNIISENGSIQHLEMLPEKMRDKYKTVWEMPMKLLIDMSADRGIYICQSQSLNLWIEDPTYSKLTSMHFYSWKKGLKTGIYYLRRKAKHQAQQFTIEPKEKESVKEEVCEMCSA